MDGGIFGKHSGMERFTLIAGILAGFFVLSLALLGFTSLRSHQIDLGTRALYTESFSFGQSGTLGTVEHVYTNEDKTRALVLLKMGEGSSLSTNAANYELFIEGCDQAGNKARLEARPSGSLYVFGSTGYYGIYLADAAGFGSELMKLTFNSTMLHSEEVPVDDYAEIIVNLGAAGTETMEGLADASVTPARMYYEAVAKPAEEALKEQASTLAEQMYTQLATVSELRNTLETQNKVEVPADPAAIAGDKVSQDGEMWVLSAGAVLSEGLEIDWTSGNAFDGYKVLASAGEDAPSELGFDRSGHVWKLRDGSEVESLNVPETRARYAEINSNIQSLVDGWGRYFSSKAEYERNLLPAMYDLQSEVASVGSATSVNSSSDFLTIW